MIGTSSETGRRGTRIPERGIGSRPSGDRPRTSERTLTRTRETVDDVNERAVNAARVLQDAVKSAENTFTKSQTSHDENETILAEREHERSKLRLVGFLLANEKRIRAVAQDDWNTWVAEYGIMMAEIAPILTQAVERYHELLNEKAAKKGRFDEKQERQLELMIDAMIGLQNDVHLVSADVAASRDRRKKSLNPDEALRYIRGVVAPAESESEAA